MSQRLSLSSTIVLRSEPQYYNTYVAFDCKRARTEYLREEECRALEHIYGRSADVGEISRESGMSRRHCERFLKRMLKLGYVDEDRKVLGHVPERVGIERGRYEGFPIPFLSAPSSVDIFIAGECNLNCLHCFSSNQKGGELPLREIESAFDQLERMGVLEVRINGGEPFLHTDIDRILLTLKQRRFRKVVITNGTLLDDDTVTLLKASGTIPTVSLDDSKAEEHDLFRGVQGSFRRTIEALEMLRRHKVQYGINCCLHKRNLKRHREIINLAVRLGASRIAFLDIKAVGRMKSHLEWAPSYNEYQKTMLDLMTSRDMYRKSIDVTLDAFMHCQPLKESVWEAQRGYVSCQAGKSRLSVDSSGSVYPCNFVLSDPSWRIGNLLQEELLDIWFSKRWLFFRGGVKIDDLPKCRGCKGLAHCIDFYCRLLPATRGDPFGPHPKCCREPRKQISKEP